ncbi:MAG: MutS-related protein, partial [Gammaproteobacteria bacterium]
MKARLIFRDRDFDWRWARAVAAEREARRTGRRSEQDQTFDPQAGWPWQSDALIQDLGLDTLFDAMAGGDDYVFEIARRLVLEAACGDPDVIRYRQDILRDCLAQPAAVRELYAIACEAEEKGKKHYLGGTLQRYPDWRLRHAIELLDALIDTVGKLVRLADSHDGEFTSEGWSRFFAMVREELGGNYLASAECRLQELKFKNGMVFSARLGGDNQGTDYVLHQPPPGSESRLKRFLREHFPRLFRVRPTDFGFALDPRDESGFRALEALKNEGIVIAADALGGASTHVRDFFAMLRAELAFYVGCINLYETLAQQGEPVCIPEVVSAGQRELSFRGLYDACLTLHAGRRAVGNEADVASKRLIVVTGANQGGKSTFLRSVGLAQLMMQCGLFVPAESLRAVVHNGLFTHFKREEDAGMKSGKFDEELARMSAIVDHLTARSMILFNESFAATNEREGSEIARQIVSALMETPVTMIYVTHLYELARTLYENNDGSVFFLRADREDDGTRTFE